MNCLRYGDELIHFTLRSQARRRAHSIAIHIEPDGRVVVDAPQAATEAMVLAAVQARAGWISRRLAESRERGAQLPPREHVSGESLYFLGRQYLLKVVADDEARGSVRIRAGHMEIAVSRPGPLAVRAALEAWYRDRARETLAARLEAIAASLPWVRAVPPLRLQAMKRRWGSCSPTGRLTLNPHLVKASRECIDYVIVHELCHLDEHNHGPAFHRLLDARMPGWREVKQRLDSLAGQLIP